MSLADTFHRVRSGVFHIVYFDGQGQRLGSGSAFTSCGYLITNHHVYLAHGAAEVWIRGETEQVKSSGFTLSYLDFKKRLRSGSEENNCDYAILDVPEIVNRKGVHSFIPKGPAERRHGDSVAFAGYPFEHYHLSCHAGIISAFYRSGPASIIQLDASVNASNSGGPLFDITTGELIGIVTRRATGLTRSFAALRETLRSNMQLINVAGSNGSVRIFGIDLMDVITASQQQMLVTLSEIERQANVGIGYAFSAEHIMSDNLVFDSIRPGAG